MLDKKFIGLIFLFTAGVLLLGILITSAGRSSEVLSANSKAVASETSYSWGDIGINDGDVEKIFEIKNEGSETLKLSDVTTSCMCTTAQLSLGDTKSPVFGMHTKFGYTLDVPPGESAQLKIIFDPAFHGPSGVGPITRQVTVDTNDADNPMLNFMLTAMVRK